MTIGRNVLQIRRWIGTTFPILKRYKRIIKWRLVTPLSRALTRHRTKRRGLHVDPYQMFWVSPRAIKYAIYRQLEGIKSTESVAGVIKSGSWDTQSVLVQDLTIIQGAVNRFINGKKWKETNYYRTQTKKIAGGEVWRGCSSIEDLDQYFSNFDELYRLIKRDGYKPQSRILDSEFAGTAAVENEIAVHIDRDGRYIFCNGAHRLSIALVLGIEKIPAKVCIRHAKWQAFCLDILSHANDNSGKVYQPITHPDLQHISSAHGEERFSIIRSHLPQNKGKILDIGANWGYFCHRFEELGFDCTAVEFDPENQYFLNKLKIAQDRKFKIVAQSILDFQDDSHFDVVFALNIFHHFLKCKEDHRSLIDFLQRMNMSMMIFEPHHTAEPQMKGAYRNYVPGEFVEFITKHSGFSHYELIGQAGDERPLFKLW